jgi:CRISPR-associated endonuclease/helicase Cas3
MAIWLVARALGANVPRRLVYVVDRRAVVDQATDTALKLRKFVDGHPAIKSALGLGSRPFPISTLRGQYIDNREWMEDPSMPAIIVGTVDMIGSRLLFEGYGVSRKMRAYQAGLLGVDTLLVLDEAHLVPPFEHLVRTIASGAHQFGPRDPALRAIVPGFRVLGLSATGRDWGREAGEVFTLTEADEAPGSVSAERLNAAKRLRIEAPVDARRLPEKLAERAWEMVLSGPARIVVYVTKRTDAIMARGAVDKLAKADKRKVDTELFVGARRVYERQRLHEWVQDHGFFGGEPATEPAVIFATSAGEVGVDLDADHIVCDMVAWERMVQRLGRVNRRGKRREDNPSLVDVFPDSAQLDKHPEWRQALEALPGDQIEGRDASPRAIRQFQHDQSRRCLLNRASTPEPLRPALTRALVDAWSLTSLEEHTGRPRVDPWLRGWQDDEPQATVVWREHLPVRPDKQPPVRDDEKKAFFEAAPPHLLEKLEARADDITAWLFQRAKTLRKNPPENLRASDVVAFLLDHNLKPEDSWSLADLIRLDADARAKKAWRERTLPGKTLVVDQRLGGLTHGMLDGKTTATVEWVGDVPPGEADDQSVVPFRIRRSEKGDASWRTSYRFVTHFAPDGEPVEWLFIQRWRSSSLNEDDRGTGCNEQLLSAHVERVEKLVSQTTERLRLQPKLREALTTAAKWHDQGKLAKPWRQAFNAPAGGPWAKTVGPFRWSLLGGYRHELGSLLDPEAVAALDELPSDTRELAKHLIIAHHGFGRPVIRTDGCEDRAPTELEEQTREIALRFVRLQRQWGPWGLAWMEALLRAADQQASREHDEAPKAREEAA